MHRVVVRAMSCSEITVLVVGCGPFGEQEKFTCMAQLRFKAEL